MRPIDPRLAIGAVAALVGGGDALAQPRDVLPYPDDSVIARDALPRVGEFVAAQNFGEAVRVVQSILDTEADAVVEGTEKQLYIAVRSAVHSLLLAEPQLLERYRVASEPRAAALLEAGELRKVERSYFLTSTGLTAAMALAQLEIEGARFESARLVLEDLPSHPDFGTGTNARDVAALATLVSRYLPRPEVTDWARDLRTKAAADGLDEAPVAWPESLKRAWRNSLAAQPVADLVPTGSAPLQSVPIESVEDPNDTFEAARSFREFASKDGRTAWVLPTVRDDVLYVNDGITVAAFDHATLSPVWRVQPGNPSSTSYGRDLNTLSLNSWRGLEDVATVTLHSDFAIVAMGTPAAGVRTGDRRVHALDAATGTVRWSADVSAMDPRLADTSIRGPVLVEGDTVVVTARRPSGPNRTIGLYLVGLDLSSGGLRWIRHLGSIGSVTWSRQQSRPEAAVASRGIIYRTDEMGLVAAVDAASGRPRWVRLVPSGRGADGAFAGPELPPPYEVSAPVVDGDAIIVIDPSTAAIVRYDGNTGKVLGTRRITEGGPRDVAYAPKYLVRAGNNLAVMCEASMLFVPIADLTGGKLGPPLDGEWSPVGRAVASGDDLLIPVRAGILRVSPGNPQQPTLMKVEQPGNLLIAGEGPSAHPLTIDGSRLHTYLRWEDARVVLEARLERNPGDPRPLLTYIELASRAGHSDLTPSLADRVLAIARDQPTAVATRSRTELFELLLAMVRAGRPATTAAPRRFYQGLQPVTNPELLDSVVQRLGIAGEEPTQQVEYLFELASLRETQGRAPEAVEALQRVLVETELATAGAMTEDPSAITAKAMGGDEAARRLTNLLRRVGHSAYTAFDGQAAAEIAAMPADADGDSLVAAARRYPLAAATPEVWRRAAAWFFARERQTDGLAALGQALVSEETSVAIGRPDRLAQLAAITEELAGYAGRAGRIEAAERLARRVSNGYPGVILSPAATDAGRTATLAKRVASPHIGDSVHGGVQVVPGWVPADVVLPDVEGRTGDCVAMVNESMRAVGVWGVNLATDQLEPLWERQIESSEPVLMTIRHDLTLLFWPTPGGGELEAISNYTGKSLWKSREFLSLFGGGNASGQRMRSPMDQDVSVEDFVAAIRGDTLVLAQRSGRCAAFSLSTGEAIWHQELDGSRIFEVAIVGPRVLLAGTSPVKDVAGSPPLVVGLSLKTGERESAVAPEVLGDHVRWLRPVTDTEALVATSESVLRVNTATGAVVWRTTGDPCAMSAPGWVVGESVFITDDQSRIWKLALADGKPAPEPCDTRGKVSYPMRGAAIDGRFALLSPSGAAIFGQDGSLVGVDTVNSFGKLLPPVLADGRIVMIESYDERASRLEENTLSVMRLFILDTKSAKLMGTQKLGVPVSALSSLAVIDGKVLLSIGTATIVFGAP